MAEKKPRVLQDSRDLMWSLIPLLAICAVIAGVAGSCNWGFGSEAAKQNIPDFNSAAAFRADAATLPFPIREPEVPADWKSNSGSTTTVGGSLTSNVGWIVPSGAYVQLTQSAATEDQLAPRLGGDGVLGTGMRDIDGRTWVTYRNEAEKKQVWITDLGDVRLAVMSRGSDADLTTLAAAAQRAEPLPTTR